MTYPFLKGHGTENDFVLLPDLDGSIHGGRSAEELAERVRALCDRRAGIGGDGVLRVVRASGPGAEWFMDYRNADGSLSEMCGNGIRLFVRYLVDTGLADPATPIRVDTRDGVKTLTVDGDLITADMGTPTVLGDTTVIADGITWAARHVDMGNPHAVAFVSRLEEPGPLLEPPRHDPAVFPDGVNVEFVVRRGERHIAMRVHERGSGETRSCGTGACAAMVATAVAHHDRPGAGDGQSDVAYRVDVPGGTLTVTWTADDRILLTGPAVVVASGTTDL
ncbi:MAG TPA: diaminopimelate epimerase [Nocardioides sp.]|uniref:diaminopimelate epimerase n=1 Tax=Nocardioides sp. TaxID=35761 RepID=UPI002E352423|nr:diaminopimelate epimerase [Nocardioides sp.]HEX5086793.1 diaminopimelate epimerase [Nocardioides sp.]